MSEDDPDSFERWMARQNKKTSLVVVLIIMFAAYGFMHFLSRLEHCRASQNCYSTDNGGGEYWD
jgi:hypothetical protein